jgi:hypothetical protein
MRACRRMVPCSIQGWVPHGAARMRVEGTVQRPGMGGVAAWHGSARMQAWQRRPWCIRLRAAFHGMAWLHPGGRGHAACVYALTSVLASTRCEADDKGGGVLLEGRRRAVGARRRWPWMDAGPLLGPNEASFRTQHLKVRTRSQPGRHTRRMGEAQPASMVVVSSSGGLGVLGNGALVAAHNRRDGSKP